MKLRGRTATPVRKSAMGLPFRRNVRKKPGLCTNTNPAASVVSSVGASNQCNKVTKKDKDSCKDYAHSSVLDDRSMPPPPSCSLSVIRGSSTNINNISDFTLPSDGKEQVNFVLRIHKFVSKKWYFICFECIK